MVVDETVRARRADILRIASANGATRVRIFGSMARGEAGPESDVDLLIDLEPSRHLLDLVAIKQRIWKTSWAERCMSSPKWHSGLLSVSASCAMPSRCESRCGRSG